VDILLTVLGVLAVAVTVSYLVARGALRRQADRGRREAQRTREEEHAALMGTIASGLAHEIRNPLGTLSLNLQLLQEDWADPITDREKKSARKIGVLLKEVRHLETILNNFLKFAAGRQLRLERVDLNKVLDELLEFAAPQVARAKVRVIRRRAPEAPPVQADAELVRQCLWNLILNAIQAMPEGGELEVVTEPGPGVSRVRIRDTGVGIAPEHLEKIFNLYYSTKPAGTGLGLPMAKKIAEEHGGSILVESAPGRGSTFTLELPTLDARPAPHDDKAP